jgi:hypothetical protein
MLIVREHVTMLNQKTLMYTGSRRLACGAKANDYLFLSKPGFFEVVEGTLNHAD